VWQIISYSKENVTKLINIVKYLMLWASVSNAWRIMNLMGSIVGKSLKIKE